VTRASIVLAAALAITACWSRGRGLDPEAGFEGAGQITIEVSNRSYSEATLHVYRGGERFRLGIVGALDDARFTMDWQHSLELQVLIRLLAGPSCLTRPLPVDPGDIIDLAIENDLTRDLDCIRVGS